MRDAPEIKKDLENVKTTETGEVADSVLKGKQAIANGFLTIEEMEQEEVEVRKLIARAREELKTNGITSEQREAYGPRSDKMYTNVKPRGYDIFTRGAEYFLGPFKDREVWDGNEETKGKFFKKVTQARDDAWALYLGLPQKYETFGISDYRPTNSKEKKYYFCLSRKHEDALLTSALKERKESNKDKIVVTDKAADVMGSFTLTFSEDEKGPYISYYDLWDLDPPLISGAERFAGKPYEIYSRIYYDPETGKRVD